MPPRKKPIKQLNVGDLPEILAPVPTIFAATQASLASHRKNINALHAVYRSCVSVTAPTEDGESVRLVGEKAFNETLIRMVGRVVGIKKGVEQAEKVVKFISAFVAFAVDYDEQERAKQDMDDGDDYPSSRLVSQLLNFLLKGFLAKNKVVRYRSVQLVACLINSLGELEDDSYNNLKLALISRVRDKEAIVRLQAVVALARLQGADESNSDEEEPKSESEESDVPQRTERKAKMVEQEDETLKVVDVLIESMVFDAAHDVRRAALLNVLITPKTTPFILQRTYDIDTINRRSLYTHILTTIAYDSLSAQERNAIVIRGMDERDENVRKAAMLHIGKWIESVGGVLSFLNMLDLTQDIKVGDKALEAVFEKRPDLLEGIEFGEEYYEAMTPSKAFLLRSYVAYLRQNASPVLDDVSPVMTRLSYLIGEQWTRLVALIENNENKPEQRDCLIICSQLLEEARDGDYADEIGRRAMFDLMRGLLGHHSLPVDLIPLCLDILQKGGIQERDFVRIVVEIVQVLREDVPTLDTSMDIDSEEELDEQEDDDSDMDIDPDAPPKKRRVKLAKAKSGNEDEIKKKIELRCLAICRALLSKIMGAIQGENSIVHGLVVDHIVPAVRSKDHDIRAEGLLCLGLGCLLDKSMALDSFELLARQSQSTEGSLQIGILQTLFDMLMVHGLGFGEERGFGPEVIMGFLLNSLEQEEQDVIATAVVGISKLLLFGYTKNEELLTRLLLLYFASETADNQELRQCLSYFFPRYCAQDPTNQRRVGNVTISSIILLKSVYDDLDDKSVMVSPLQIGSQLLDWTDPMKMMGLVDGYKPDEKIQFDMALETLQLLFTLEQKEERKLLCQLLPKLYIPPELNLPTVKSALQLISALKEYRPLTDAVSRNALARFETLLLKPFSEQLKELDPTTLENSKEIKHVKEWLKSTLDGEYEDDDETKQEKEDEEESKETIGKLMPSTKPKRARSVRAASAGINYEDSSEPEQQKSESELEEAEKDDSE